MWVKTNLDEKQFRFFQSFTSVKSRPTTTSVETRMITRLFYKASEPREKFTERLIDHQYNVDPRYSFYYWDTNINVHSPSPGGGRVQHRFCRRVSSNRTTTVGAMRTHLSNSPLLFDPAEVQPTKKDADETVIKLAQRQNWRLSFSRSHSSTFQKNISKNTPAID